MAQSALRPRAKRAKRSTEVEHEHLTPCAECGVPVGSAHTCGTCTRSIHAFCGLGIDPEGYGQRRRCSQCAVGSGACSSGSFGAATSSVAADAPPIPHSSSREGTAVLSSPATAAAAPMELNAPVIDLTEHLPPQSKLAEPRKIRTLPPNGQRKPKKQAPNKKLAERRVQEFVDQSFKVLAGVLFCDACKTELSTEITSVKRHVQAERHVAQLAALRNREQNNLQIAMNIDDWMRRTHAQGATLAVEQSVYRMKLLRFLLGTGIPVAKMESAFAKEFLQECAKGWVGRVALSELIPLSHDDGVALVKSEMEGQQLAICFDGTTKVAEVYAIVVRWITPDFCVQQRLAHLGFYRRSLKHQNIAAVLSDVITRSFQVNFRNVISFQRDRATANTAAMNLLRQIYPDAEDIACLSHTLDHCGEHFRADELHNFMRDWLALLSSSHIASTVWEDLAGSAFPSHSATRWWSFYECLEYFQENIACVPRYLFSPDHAEYHGKRLRALVDVWRNPLNRIRLELQLAAELEIGRIFKKTTAALEGDGALSFIVYDELYCIESERTVAFENMAYPALLAKAAELARQTFQLRQDENIQQIEFALLEHARAVGAGVFEYWRSRIWGGQLQDQVLLFKVARLTNPYRMAVMQPSAATVAADLQRVAEVVDINGLITELPRYLALATGLQANVRNPLKNMLAFWRHHHEELPNWCQFTRRSLLWQPSSAAAERVFSMLKAIFDSNQERAKQDYISSSVMLRYNELCREELRELRKLQQN